MTSIIRIDEDAVEADDGIEISEEERRMVRDLADVLNDYDEVDDISKSAALQVLSDHFYQTPSLRELLAAKVSEWFA